MATLGMIVSRMRAAGESQEAIDAVRREYEKVNPPKSDFKPAALTEAQDFLKDTRAYAPRQVSEEPEDFFGGFHKSLASGEALKAGAKGALGFAKGAVVDLPKSIAGTAKTAAGLLSFGNPQRQIEAGTELWEGIKQLPSHIKETTLRAGSEPEAFGRMVGQFTGQPLVGDAALIGVPKLRMPAAKLVEGTGKLLSKAQPTSAPGNIPVSPRMIGLRTASRAAGAVGRKLQSTGEGMRIRAATATPTKGVPLKGETPGELTSEDLSKFAGGGQGRTRPRPIRFDTPDLSRNYAFEQPDLRPYVPPPPRPPGLTQEPAGRPPIPVSPPPTATGRLTGNRIPTIEEQFASMVEEARAPEPAPSVELPVDLSQPVTNYPSRLPKIEPPQRGGRLTGQKALTTEEQMAEAIRQTQEELAAAEAQQSGVELPPPPYSLGEAAPPTQPVVNFNPRAPRTPEPTPAPVYPEGHRLVTEKVPTAEEQMANIIEELRQADAQAPRVEAPPPPYSQGAGAPPEQPRVDVKTARTPRGGEESPYSHLSLEQLEQILAERKAGGPGIIPPKPSAPVTTPPKSGPTTDPATMFTPEELELLKSPEAQAALEQMAARDAGVDITTGEIMEPPPSPPRRAGKKMNAPNLRERANKFASDVEGSKEIPGWAESVAEWLTRKKPTNPLRPEVPEGQVTNRRMFDLSAERGAENRLAAEAAGFADEVSPAGPEFSEDMLFTPDELRNSDIPEMISPVENPFDPRIAPGGVVSEAVPVAEKPSLFNRGKEAVKKFIADEEGSINFGDEKPNVERISLERARELSTEGEVQATIKNAWDKLMNNQKLSPSERTLLSDELNNRVRELENKTLTPDESAELKYLNNTLRKYPEIATSGSHQPPEVPIPKPAVEAPSPGEAFDIAKARFYELTEKGTNGTLTMEELTEAKSLNRMLRDMNFERPPDVSPYKTPTPTRGVTPRPNDPIARERVLKQIEDIKASAPPPEVPIKKSLFGDERGAVGPDINKSNPIKTVAQNSKKYQVTDPNGKRLGDITVDNDQIRQMKTVAQFKDVPDERIASVIYKTKLKRILEAAGLGEGNVTITPVSMEAKRAEAVKPAVPVEKAEPTTTSRLTKGGETVAEKKTVPEPEETLSEPPAASPEKKTFPSVEERRTKTAGKPKTEDMPPIPEAFAGTPAPGMKAASSKGYSASTTIETGKKNPLKVKVRGEDIEINPEDAFRSGGNTYAVQQAASNLEEIKAPDIEYKNLMPKAFQFELAKGETFKDRLARMLDAHKEGKRKLVEQTSPTEAEAVPAEKTPDFVKESERAARQARIDKFVEEVTGEAPELRAKRLNKPAEPPPPVAEKRKIPKLRGPIPQGARITLKKVNPHTVKEVEDAGFVNSGRFDKDGNPIYVKSQRFSDKANKAAQDFGKKN